MPTKSKTACSRARLIVFRAATVSESVRNLVGTGRFELPTCRLGGDRSIHLSYVPEGYISILSMRAGQCLQVPVVEFDAVIKRTDANALIFAMRPYVVLVQRDAGNA